MIQTSALALLSRPTELRPSVLLGITFTLKQLKRDTNPSRTVNLVEKQAENPEGTT